MERVVIEKPGVVRISRVSRPKPGPGAFLVRTVLTGISAGTEMMLFRGTHPNLESGKWGYWNEYPILPGYELVGEVEEVGPGVEDFRPGDRVVSLSPHASHVLVSSGKRGSAPTLCFEIPDGVEYETAMFSVLGATARHAVHRAGLVPGETVVIVGLGVVGLLALLQAKLAGAGVVIGVDVRRERLAMAEKLGAELVLDGKGIYLDERILNLVPDGADLVIEATGKPQGLETALLLAGDRARVVVLGFHAEPVSLLLGDDFYHKELTIVASKAAGPENSGSSRGRGLGTAEANMEEVLELMRQGNLKPDPLITHRFSYREVEKAYRMIDEGKEEFIQVVLEWG